MHTAAMAREALVTPKVLQSTKQGKGHVGLNSCHLHARLSWSMIGVGVIQVFMLLEVRALLGVLRRMYKAISLQY
jgi:hypothetical protein